MAPICPHIRGYWIGLCYYRLYSSSKNYPHTLHFSQSLCIGHYNRCTSTLVTQVLQSYKLMESHHYALKLRYFCHFILGANQGSIFHWSRDHRLHHKYSDTELDPHTISKGFFFAHVGWLLVKKTPKMIE